VRRTTKLIEGGHRGLQHYRLMRLHATQLLYRARNLDYGYRLMNSISRRQRVTNMSQCGIKRSVHGGGDALVTFNALWNERAAN